MGHQADSIQSPPNDGAHRDGRSDVRIQPQNILKAAAHASLTPEQEAAYARLSRLEIDWGGKPITDRDAANAR